VWTTNFTIYRVVQSILFFFTGALARWLFFSASFSALAFNPGGITCFWKNHLLDVRATPAGVELSLFYSFTDEALYTLVDSCWNTTPSGQINLASSPCGTNATGEQKPP
jgi:hypothetical protein